MKKNLSYVNLATIAIHVLLSAWLILLLTKYAEISSTIVVLVSLILISFNIISGVLMVYFHKYQKHYKLQMEQ